MWHGIRTLCIRMALVNVASRLLYVGVAPEMPQWRAAQQIQFIQGR